MSDGAAAGTGCPIHPWVAGGQGRIRFGIAYGPRTEWGETAAFVREVEPPGFGSY